MSSTFSSNRYYRQRDKLVFPVEFEESLSDLHKKAVYDRLIKILYKHNCTFLLLEPALEKGRGWYYHPVNGEPITSISLELSLPKKRQIKSGTFVDPQEDCIELFVLFSYEKERRLELQNTIDITHRQAICPVVRNDLPCGFQGFLRNSATLHHKCPRLFQQDIFQHASLLTTHQPSIDPKESQSESSREVNTQRESILNQLLSVLGGTSISQTALSSKLFRSFCLQLMETARQNPSVCLEELFPQYSSYYISMSIRNRARQKTAELMNSLQRTSVAIMIDATKIHHQSFLAICIASFTNTATTHFFHLCHSPKTSEEYCQMLIELASYLIRFDIQIGNICTDALPAQLRGLEKFRQWQFRTAMSQSAPYTIQHFHTPCLNHRINLVTQFCLQRDPELNRITEIVQQFAAQTHKQDIFRRLGKTSPSFLPTRWLSCHYIASFIRLNREKILNEHLLTILDLKDVLLLEIVLTPLIELHLFFEMDSTKLLYAFPAILRCFCQYQKLIINPIFNASKWQASLQLLMIKLFNETIAGSVGKLALLAFSLTPIGRVLLQYSSPFYGYVSNKPITSTLLELNRLTGKPLTIVLTEVNNLFEPFPLFSSSFQANRLSSSSESLSSSSSSSLSPNTTLLSTAEQTEIPEEISQSSKSKPPYETDVFSFLMPEILPTSSAPSTHQSLSDSFRMDSFRESLGTAKEMPSAPRFQSDSTTSTAASEVIPEKRVQNIDSLLQILNRLENQAVLLSEQQPIDEDEYGLLEEEQKAQDDEYIDRSTPFESASRMSTRLTQLTSEEHQESDETDPLNDWMTDSFSSSSSHILDLMEDEYHDPADRNLLSEEPIPSLCLDPPSQKTLASVEALILSLKVTINKTFFQFAQTVLPFNVHSIIPNLMDIFNTVLLTSNTCGTLTDLNVELLSYSISPKIEAIFKHLVRLLVFAPCSESSCERVFSRVRAICGERKYALAPQTLTARLVLYNSRSRP